MIERIVEHWLTRAGERGYETPFVQLLTTEGYRVLHGPVHHPQEHGKDIVAISPDGELCAFQLKGPNIGLAEFEDYAQGQLLSLLAAGISYPGVDPPRPPERAFLVTNGTLTPPVRGRLEALNVGNAARQLGKLECIEKEHLLSRFIRAHGRYLPSEPQELNDLLQLLLQTGNGFLDVAALTNLLNKTVGIAPDNPESEASRSVSSAFLLTSYAIAPWERKQNHLAIAQGWLTLCAAIIHYACKTGLHEKNWRETYYLAFAGAEEALTALTTEAADLDDLILPDLSESLVYPTRALIVCGHLSALWLSAGRKEGSLKESIRVVLLRELPFVRLVGEAGFPSLFLIATALDAMGQHDEAAKLIALWAATIVRVNAPSSPDAVPDPYHSHAECLRRSIGAEVSDPEERFDGNSYSLHVAIDWLARRGARQFLTALWPAVTRISFCEYEVSARCFAMWPNDRNGVLKMWHAGQPESWASLEAAAVAAPTGFPNELTRFPQIVPFIGLLFPERFTRAMARMIDASQSRST